MFAPRLRTASRPVLRQATQCLRQHEIHPLPRNFISSQMRQQRYASKKTVWTQSKKLAKENPVTFPISIILILCGVAGLGYANWFYYSYIVGAFHKYPEPVAKELRKALYYTNISLDAQKASKYYASAMRVAQEVGMDPYSDEVIGIRIQIAALMEKISQFNRAILVLELLKKDCLKWIDENGAIEGQEGNRTRLLRKSVEISMRLGSLYAGEYVKESEKAEESTVWGVETALKEVRRREEEGVKPDEGEWLTKNEIGASLEALAHVYEEKNLHYLAAPLFLQALALSSQKDCHTTVLMNNLAISISQQLPPPTPGTPPASRPELVHNARQWAQKALDIAAKITPPERTEECEMGCAVATHNLGEFAEMDGDIAEARRKYEEAKGLAKAINFQDGVILSEEALRRLSKK